VRTKTTEESNGGNCETTAPVCDPGEDECPDGVVDCVWSACESDCTRTKTTVDVNGGTCAVEPVCNGGDDECPDVAVWYCVAKGYRCRSNDIRVLGKDYSLSEAQGMLIVDGNACKAIIPMSGVMETRGGVTNLGGDPHDLAKYWDGGEMRWDGWNGINLMRTKCALESAPILEEESYSEASDATESESGTSSNSGIMTGVAITVGTVAMVALAAFAFYVTKRVSKEDKDKALAADAEMEKEDACAADDILDSGTHEAQGLESGVEMK